MTQYFAKVARSLEEIAAQELEQLGAKSVRPDFTGVYFEGDRSLLYRVNLWSRIIFRVLVPIQNFSCSDAKKLYQAVQRISWEKYIRPNDTFAVHCTGGNRVLNHTHFSALQVKNAIVDQQRQQWGERSSIDTEDPDIVINLHIDQDRGILSLDSSGNSLHRRGYRQAVGKAPLKETLAAALLEMAEWQPNMPFLDPMCGSGTLPLEAALKGLNVAPGLFRETFGFMKWQDFDGQLWDSLYQEAEKSQLSQLESIIVGCDRDGEMLAQARYNAQQCGVEDQIRLTQATLFHLEPPADHGIIICNPPYGERLGDVEKLGSLYQQLGDVFKQRFKGWTAFIITGNKALAKQVGLRTAQRIPVYNGTIACTLLKYELY
ncbi:THUMP domain-containing class I SAM-dependent RNA methyltransferase [Limnoraphis robusta]|uniref:RNA methyltransferase n=1 Tax=Limnoraphis robusta CS-951 TaxID=1637645 RepID=A0A0F5YHB2_9CYAN|nr:THUMP domain-containing protein [Limnoraphis robusta]KKD38304.1 RNA methyltransferase [Limnoraphis robusta CS-951]